MIRYIFYNNPNFHWGLFACAYVGASVCVQMRKDKLRKSLTKKENTLRHYNFFRYDVKINGIIIIQRASFKLQYSYLAQGDLNLKGSSLVGWKYSTSIHDPRVLRTKNGSLLKQNIFKGHQNTESLLLTSPDPPNAQHFMPRRDKVSFWFSKETTPSFPIMHEIL